MPFDGFEMTLSDSIEAYRALVPTTVLSGLQIMEDAREAVDLEFRSSQYTDSYKRVEPSDNCAYSFLGRTFQLKARNENERAGCFASSEATNHVESDIKRSNFVYECTEKQPPDGCCHMERTLDLHGRTWSFGEPPVG